MDDFFMREGWLQKKGVEGLKSWSKRYFTLEDEELYYYENKGDVAPKGRILLTDIQRVDSVSGGFFSRGYYFNAVTKDRTYELCAEDDNDRKEWISILQRASAHFKKMAKEAPVNTNETYDASDMNMNDDEEHVELTEEDMNDPDLLGELTELHGKEGLIEHLKELSAKIDSDKQKCIQFRDAGNIEEAKKLLLKVKNLQKQKESLELKIQNYDKQEEELEEEVTEEPQEEEEPVEEEQAEEEDMPSHDDTKSSATEESLVEVERRIEGFKNLALNAKKQGNIAQATQYMKSYKVLLQAKEQLDVGIQMDLSKLPNLDPALPSTTSTTTTPTSAPSSSSRPKSNSVTPPPTKNVEAERLEALSILEEELRRQYEVAKTKALAAKEKGDKHTALEQLNITKDVKHHLEEIIKAKSLPHVPVPKYHFEMKEHTIEKKHDDLLDNEIEITILNCKGIKDPAITSPYYHVLFPYPNSEDPQKSSSSSFSVSKSADFQHTCKMTIERKKSFQIFCERKKIFVELYQSRLLLSSVLLGKGELKMSTLLEKCETKETIEIKNGRKLICVVDVSVRLKKPVVKQQHIDKIVEKVLVIDEHYTSAPPPAETPKEAPVVETPKVKVPEPVKKEPEPSKKEEEPTPSTEDDYLSVDYLISNDVLEFERDLLAAKISALKGQAPDELVDRKQAVELKLQILSVQASTGQLDQEKYIQDMRDKIVVEKKLAGRLSKEGNKEAALMAMKRVKIMEKEIEASLE